jgi:hypothetical protein
MDKPSMTERPQDRGVRPKHEVNEKQRTYHYLNGAKIILKNVTEVIVSASGNHRVKADGKLWIIATGWIAVEIDEKEWTF